MFAPTLQKAEHRYNPQHNKLSYLVVEVFVGPLDRCTNPVQAIDGQIWRMGQGLPERIQKCQRSIFVALITAMQKKLIGFKLQNSIQHRFSSELMQPKPAGPCGGIYRFHLMTVIFAASLHECLCGLVHILIGKTCGRRVFLTNLHMPIFSCGIIMQDVQEMRMGMACS